MLCLSLAVAAPARRCITACLHRARSWLCPIRAVQQFCAFVAILHSATLLPDRASAQSDNCFPGVGI